MSLGGVQVGGGLSDTRLARTLSGDAWLVLARLINRLGARSDPATASCCPVRHATWTFTISRERWPNPMAYVHGSRALKSERESGAEHRARAAVDAGLWGARRNA